MMPDLLPVVFTVIVGLTFPYLPVSHAGGNTDLLMSTLRGKFVFACDNDFLNLKCPNNSVISIDNANYGRRVSNTHMCPYRWSTIGSYQVKQFHEDTNCRAVNSRQIIVNMCESRQNCKLQVSHDLFGDDPCPGTSKYLDVTYKCRPNTFLNKVVCENSHMKLHCNVKEVLAIRSAGFGRPIAENMKCPSYSMDETKCEAESSLVEVMKRCHGKRRCTVKASERNFGDPCQKDTYKYLSVTYTCVSKKIFLKPRRFTVAPTTNPPTVSYADNATDVGSSAHMMTETSGLTQGPDIFSPNGTGDSSLDDSDQHNTSLDQSPTLDEDEPMGFFTSILATIGHIQSNREVILLYMTLGCCVGIIGTLLWFVVRLRCQNRDLKEKIEESGTPVNVGTTTTDGATSTSSPNGTILDSVRQENRVDINEIWNTPSPSLATPQRPENGIEGNTRHWETATHVAPGDSHTLPAVRNLNSYFP